jgi:hypothetical protein
MADKFKFVSPGVTFRENDINVVHKQYIRIATHVLLFGQEKWILKNLENAYPHVDVIYLSYSEKPWTYNPNARNQYKNNREILDKIIKSPWADKIHFIVGEWDTEEQQRNRCVQCAQRDGIDYLIIHDADEFYSNVEFQSLIEEMKRYPDYDYYKVSWICFWKNFNYSLLDENGNYIVGQPEFAINVKRGVEFVSKRRPNSTNFKLLTSGICYHGSYVLTNEELLQKINTWGHTNEFDKNYWYNEKWLKWTEESTNLHLVHPPAWSKAAKFDGRLPEVIADMR